MYQLPPSLGSFPLTEQTPYQLPPVLGVLPSYRTDSLPTPARPWGPSLLQNRLLTNSRPSLGSFPLPEQTPYQLPPVLGVLPSYRRLLTNSRPSLGPSLFQNRLLTNSCPSLGSFPLTEDSLPTPARPWVLPSSRTDSLPTPARPWGPSLLQNRLLTNSRPSLGSFPLTEDSLPTPARPWVLPSSRTDSLPTPARPWGPSLFQNRLLTNSRPSLGPFPLPEQTPYQLPPVLGVLPSYRRLLTDSRPSLGSFPLTEDSLPTPARPWCPSLLQNRLLTNSHPSLGSFPLTEDSLPTPARPWGPSLLQNRLLTNSRPSLGSFPLTEQTPYQLPPLLGVLPSYRTDSLPTPARPWGPSLLQNRLLTNSRPSLGSFPLTEQTPYQLPPVLGVFPLTEQTPYQLPPVLGVLPSSRTDSLPTPARPWGPSLFQNRLLTNSRPSLGSFPLTEQTPYQLPPVLGVLPSYRTDSLPTPARPWGPSLFQNRLLTNSRPSLGSFPLPEQTPYQLPPVLGVLPSSRTDSLPTPARPWGPSLLQNRLLTNSRPSLGSFPLTEQTPYRLPPVLGVLPSYRTDSLPTPARPWGPSLLQNRLLTNSRPSLGSFPLTEQTPYQLPPVLGVLPSYRTDSLPTPARPWGPSLLQNRLLTNSRPSLGSFPLTEQTPYQLPPVLGVLPSSRTDSLPTPARPWGPSLFQNRLLTNSRPSLGSFPLTEDSLPTPTRPWGPSLFQNRLLTNSRPSLGSFPLTEDSLPTPARPWGPSLLQNRLLTNSHPSLGSFPLTEDSLPTPARPWGPSLLQNRLLTNSRPSLGSFPLPEQTPYRLPPVLGVLPSSRTDSLPTPTRPWGPSLFQNRLLTDSRPSLGSFPLTEQTPYQLPPVLGVLGTGTPPPSYRTCLADQKH